MVDAASVQKLNSAIEKINTQRTKSETRIEMLRKRLNGDLERYSSQYGVKLQGSTFQETKERISAEVGSVIKKVEDEYNLKIKVVRAIESGDYQEAYALMGIEQEDTQKEDGALPEDALADIDGLDSQGAFSSNEYDNSVEDEELSFMNMMEPEAEDSDLLGGQEDMHGSYVADIEEVDGFKDASFESEDDDEELDGFKDVSFESEDEDDDMDFGFGEILQGSKFQL